MAGVGTKAEKAGKDVEKAAEHGGRSASRLGGIFQTLGQTAGNWGIPFSESLSKVGEKVSDAEGGMGGFLTKMSAVGGVTAGAGAAGLAVVAGEAIHLGDAFSSATAQIASSAGISQTAATNIGNAFKSIRGEESANELAKAYATVAGQLGATQGHALNAAQAVGVMSAAEDLADAKIGSLSETTSALATVMQAYGLSATQAGSVSDELYGITTKTGVGLGQVTTVLQRLHAQLGQATPPISQVGGLILDLTEHGESGRQAISGLSSAMATLEKTSTTTMTTTGKATTHLSAAGLEAQKLGLNVYDASGHFIGMSSIIDQLQPKLATMTQQQQMFAVQELFGSSAGEKMLATILAGPKAYDAATAAVNKSNQAHAAAEAQEKTLTGETKVLGAQVENLGISAGQWLIPKLQELASDTATVVGWFEKHTAVAEALAGVIGGVLATAVGVFTVNKLAALAKGVANTAQSIGGLISKITGLGGSSGLSSAGESAASAIDSAGETLQTASESMTTAADSLDSSATALDSAATALDAAASKLTAAGAEEEVAAEAQAATGAEGAAAGGATAAEAAGGATAAEAAGAAGAGAEAAGGAGLLEAGLATGGVGLVAGGLGMAAAYAFSKMLANDENFQWGKSHPLLGMAGSQTLGNLSNLEKNQSGLQALSGLNLTGLSQAFGGGRQSGGSVAAGVAYTLHGVETFVPSVSGQIVPGDMASAGSGPAGSSVTIYHIEHLEVTADNPAQMQQQIAARARRSALSGNPMGGPNMATAA